MINHNFSDNFLELIRRTSTTLPQDIHKTLKTYAKRETHGSCSRFAMHLILENIQLAKRRSLPLCQDTGFLTFYITLPMDSNLHKIQSIIHQSIMNATERGFLRQNSVDTLTGKNSGNNLGPGTPAIHFSFHRNHFIDVRMIQKGGGCENMGAQYKLPFKIKRKIFNRDLEGVRACILHAIHAAQGKGCSPGFLGVCIGSDRSGGYAAAKYQLFRKMNDINPVPELYHLEKRIVAESNQLGIGPMGFKGHFTLGGCKIICQNRLPASYFVTIAYMCWAFRRGGFILNTNGTVRKWLYQKPEEFEDQNRKYQPIQFDTQSATVLYTPLKKKNVQSLTVGDIVLINGTLYTGRDAVHQYLYEGGNLDILKNAVFYHCGPVMTQKEGRWTPLAAGPTTSIREEPYESDIIRRFKLKAIIGKGGMGEETLKACLKYGCVYLHAVGGAAQVYAKTIKCVKNVYLEQFGSPEAVWELEVENFPAVVTMDARGNSLHEKLKLQSDIILEQLISGQ